MVVTWWIVAILPTEIYPLIPQDWMVGHLELTQWNGAI